MSIVIYFFFSIHVHTDMFLFSCYKTFKGYWCSLYWRNANGVLNRSLVSCLCLQTIGGTEVKLTNSAAASDYLFQRKYLVIILEDTVYVTLKGVWCLLGSDGIKRGHRWKAISSLLMFVTWEMWNERNVRVFPK